MFVFTAIMKHSSYTYSKHRATLLVRIHTVGKYVCGSGSEELAKVIIKAIKITTFLSTYHEPGPCIIIINALECQCIISLNPQNNHEVGIR